MINNKMMNHKIWLTIINQSYFKGHPMTKSKLNMVNNKNIKTCETGYLAAGLPVFILYIFLRT